jgi:hypothetical protein
MHKAVGYPACAAIQSQSWVGCGGNSYPLMEKCALWKLGRIGITPVLSVVASMAPQVH